MQFDRFSLKDWRKNIKSGFIICILLFHTMVFESSAKFQQFVHCKFRETVISAFIIKTNERKRLCLIVNKYGKVGLYDPKQRFTLVHTYILDLSTWHIDSDSDSLNSTKFSRDSAFNLVEIKPKCRQTHLVVDAVLARNLSSIFYLTNKGVLQAYDLGTIDAHPYGVDLLPEKAFGTLKSGQSSTQIKNKGHIETHRIYGIPPFPTCAEYYAADEEEDSRVNGHSVTALRGKDSLLLIGFSDGHVMIIRIADRKTLFGCPKIRNVLHEIKIQDLVGMGVASVYEAHDGPITDLRFLSERHSIVSCSKTSKSSLTFKDICQILDPFTILVPKGVNALAHCEILQILATGSEDGVIRIFNALVPCEPIAELKGHAAPIVSLEFLHVPFTYPDPILLSFSADVELRAWDTSTLECLQSLYVSFPVKSNIICKSPEFARRAIFVYEAEGTDADGLGTGIKNLKPRERDFIILLYCNSFAKLEIQKDPSYWPFDFEDLVLEFQEIWANVQGKLKWKPQSQRNFELSQNPRQRLLCPREIAEVEAKLDSYVNDVLNIKSQVDAAIEKTKVKPESTLSPQSSSAQVSKAAFALRQDRLALIKEGGAFKALPTVTLDPIEFKFDNLPLTQAMKKAGLMEVSTPYAFLTSAARKAFSRESLEDSFLEGSVARMNYNQTLATRVNIADSDTSTQNECQRTDVDSHVEGNWL